jgi:anthranilate phosphoribosyltransferase
MDTLKLSAYIKEIGRGKNAAGDLALDDARTLFSAILAGEVPDLHLGAILIALRVKGESLEELAGFARACEASYAHLPPLPDDAVPVVIPSYNGARKLPNLVPLLALLLARAGVPVLLHGVTNDPGRVTTREVFGALGIAPAASAEHACAELAQRRVAFLPVETMAPAIARLLAMRASLGVRNSMHTLVKMLQPFDAPAVRIVSVTHPEYLVRMREYFTRHDQGALLLRGAEGEAVAHPRREPAIEWSAKGVAQTWKVEASTVRDAPTPNGGRSDDGAPVLPEREAHTTARWIEAALAGKVPIPAAIEHQVACCLRAIGELKPPENVPREQSR